MEGIELKETSEKKEKIRYTSSDGGCSEQQSCICVCVCARACVGEVGLRQAGR